MTMRCIICVVLLTGLTLTAGDYAKYAEFVKQQANNATFVRMFDQHLQQFQDPNLKNAATTSEFKCKPFPQLQPSSQTSSVHKLSAMDVKVVAALGDSITAGTGITAATVIGLLREDRGLSWSVGGDKDIDSTETIPNMLKVYRPDVTGFSVGSGPVWDESKSHLNVANPGDKSEDIPAQAEKLVARMKADKNINMDEDWKVITLFVGGNDLCDFCENKEAFRAENYTSHIENALDILHDNVPRAFVNLVQVLDISIIKKLNTAFICDTLHFFLCPCGAFPANSEAEAELQRETERYRKLTNDLITSGKYDTKDDFTVVVQPFFSKTLPPNLENGDADLSYFAPDCFHLSLKGHQAASDALWNNMVESVGKKRTSWSPGEEVECPSAQAPYFYTYKNNQQQLENTAADNKLGVFGAVHHSRDFVKEPISFKHDSPSDQQSSNSHSSGVITAMIVASCVCVGLVLVGVGVVTLWRRRKGRSHERQILLKPTYSQIYT